MSIATLDMRVKRSRRGRLRAFVVEAALCFALVWCFLEGTAHAEIGQKLRDGLRASSPKVRIVAVSGVSKTKDPGARVLLEPLLKDEDGAVRATVIEALGRIGDAAALPALLTVTDDPDSTVQAVLKRVVPALEALRVFVYVGKGLDLGDSGITGIADDLRAKTKAAIASKLGPGFVVHDDPAKKSFGASPLVVRSVIQRKDGTNTFIDVKCELTLVEMPANILRAALSSTASVGVGGPVSAKLKTELAHDAVNACAPELADDFASYVREHAHR